MRNNRKPLTAEQRRKSNVRSYLHAYVKAGKIHKQPCEICGTSVNIEAHHDDYSNPLKVRWLCRYHHKQLHRMFHEEHFRQNTLR